MNSSTSLPQFDYIVISCFDLQSDRFQVVQIRDRDTQLAVLRLLVYSKKNRGRALYKPFAPLQLLKFVEIDCVVFVAMVS